MLSAIAVDDEPLALEKLHTFIKKIPEIHLVKTFSNCVEAINFIAEEQVDILFLDIQMNDMTGIELLQNFRIKPEVIIISAHSEHAVDSFELNVTDYILKPYSFARLSKGIEKCKRKKEISEINTEYIFIKTDYRIVKIEVKNILYVEGMRDYLSIQTTEGKILTLLNFPELMAMLPEKLFMRVHKSFIVSLRHIKSIERDRIYMDNKIIPISKTYKEVFYSVIGTKK